jgi:hypothetical protein
MPSSRQTRIRSDKYNSNVTKRGLVSQQTQDVNTFFICLCWPFLTFDSSFYRKEKLLKVPFLQFY